MYRVCLLLIFSLSVHAQPAKFSEHLNTVYKLPAAIYDVKGIGNWRKGSVYGQIRLVITRSSKRDDVFLQWVEWGDAGPVAVKTTVQIKEIQQEANFKTTFIRRETVKGTRQIVLGLENLYDKSAARAVIQIQNVGRYTCLIQ